MFIARKILLLGRWTSTINRYWEIRSLDSLWTIQLIQLNSKGQHFLHITLKRTLHKPETCVHQIWLFSPKFKKVGPRVFDLDKFHCTMFNFYLPVLLLTGFLLYFTKYDETSPRRNSIRWCRTCVAPWLVYLDKC